MKLISLIFSCTLAMSCFRADAAIITITAMNADGNPASELEGLLGGSGTNGSSLFAIDTSPSAVASVSVNADYTVDNVDIDNDGTFAESFSFRVTFASPENIDFQTSLESMGLGNNEVIDVDESFSMTFSVLSDTSVTHDVRFDGMSAIDFISMSDSAVDVNGTVVELNGGSTPLPSLVVNPTFTFQLGSGETAFDSGTFEDWDIQFSTAAVPEPSHFALLPLLGMSVVVGRRRKLAKQPVA